MISQTSYNLSQEYNNKLKNILKQTKTKYLVKEVSSGCTYIIESDDCVLKLTIKPDWIGYDLTVKEHVLGKKIGTRLDTDLYSLDYNIEVTREVGDELLVCMQALIDKNIYAGHYKKKRLLAIPENTIDYRLEKKGRFIVNTEMVTLSKIRSMAELKALN